MLAALFLAFSALTIQAADTATYTITIQNPNYDSNGQVIGDGNTYNFDERTYEAYQIFAGDYSKDTNGVERLSNITWGANINEAGKQALADAFNGGTIDAAAIAAALAAGGNGAKFAAVAGALNADGNSYLYLTGAPKQSSETTQKGISVTISGLAAGYYFVADKLGTLENSNRAYSEYMLQVVGDTTVSSKLSIPSVEKKTKETNDTTNSVSDWQDSGSYDLGDVIPFQLTATLPQRYAEYTSYYLKFVDTLSSALSFNAGSVKVYAVNGSDKKEVTSYFTVDTTSGLNIYTNDVKKITTVNITAATKIVVEYDATLTSNGLVVGQDNASKGNPNTVKLVYSNNPNYTGLGETSPKGETPEDKVTIFTFSLDINKVGEDKKTPLSGAVFTLQKNINGVWTDLTLVKSTDGTNFKVTGLDAGVYRLEETVAPAGYNKLTAPIYFRVLANADTLAADPLLRTVSVERLNSDLTDQSSSESDNKVAFDTTGGKLSTTVVNGTGSLLPETGSVGTRLLYILGSVFVIGAGILLITKRRMDAE